MRVAIAVVLVAAAVTSVGTMQAPAVSLSVSVFNRSGARVPGLTAADFQVFEDGIEQQAASISAGPGPVSVAVVLDTSDGMAGLGLELAQRSVEHLVAQLAPDDEVAFISYERGITVAVPWTVRDKFPKLEWGRWKTMPFSEVLQGIYQALGLMNEAKHARTAVLLVSDAEQVGSRVRSSRFR